MAISAEYFDRHGPLDAAGAAAAHDDPHREGSWSSGQ
jgi:hypothetical protein